MTEATFIQYLSVGGAAVALLYVLKQLIDGKLHTHSEVDGLLKDKAALLDVNRRQSDALEQANAVMQRILEVNRAG